MSGGFRSDWRWLLLALAVLVGTGSQTLGQQAREYATLRGHTDVVSSLAFSPDGRTLASGSRDKTIKLWEVASGKLRATLWGHTDSIRSVTFAPDGKVLASGGNDEVVRLWDATGRARGVLEGDTRLVLSLRFSPDGGTLAVADGYTTGGKVRLWDGRSGQVRVTLKGHLGVVVYVAFS